MTDDAKALLKVDVMVELSADWKVLMLVVE